jgi:hypothetical protein
VCTLNGMNLFPVVLLFFFCCCLNHLSCVATMLMTRSVVAVPVLSPGPKFWNVHVTSLRTIQKCHQPMRTAKSSNVLKRLTRNPTLFFFLSFQNVISQLTNKRTGLHLSHAISIDVRNVLDANRSARGHIFRFQMVGSYSGCVSLHVAHPQHPSHCK